MSLLQDYEIKYFHQRNILLQKTTQKLNISKSASILKKKVFLNSILSELNITY